MTRTSHGGSARPPAAGRRPGPPRALAPGLAPAFAPVLAPVTDACVVNGQDLSRLRFAVSPMWEAVASLQVLQSDRPGLHEPWAATARARVVEAGLNLSTLVALVPGTRHLADFVTPTPRGREGSVAEAAADIRSADLGVVRADLEILLGEHPTAASGAVLRAGLDDPRSLRARAADDLEAYFDVAVAPVWDRLRGLAESDIAWRLDQIAAGGLHQVLSTLHPRARFEGDRLVIERACRPGPSTPGAGLVLVPCAFAFPSLLFLDMPGHAPTASYAPRGVGMLWREAPDVDGTPLGALLGRNRAAALVLLDLPMTTTQLACHLDIAASTANEHLTVLRAAGLLTARRRGREVLYARTEVGSAMVASALPSGGDEASWD